MANEVVTIERGQRYRFQWGQRNLMVKGSRYSGNQRRADECGFCFICERFVIAPGDVCALTDNGGRICAPCAVRGIIEWSSNG